MLVPPNHPFINRCSMKYIVQLLGIPQSLQETDQQDPFPLHSEQPERTWIQSQPGDEGTTMGPWAQGRRQKRLM